jgi:hypothetical protein
MQNIAKLKDYETTFQVKSCYIISKNSIKIFKEIFWQSLHVWTGGSMSQQLSCYMITVLVKQQLKSWTM